MIIEDLILAMSGVKVSTLKQVSDKIDSSSDLWSMDRTQLVGVGLTPANINKIFSSELKERANKECEFLYKNGVVALSIKDNGYPKQLGESVDAPTIIYIKGNLDLNKNSDKFVSVVGTRNSTPLGETICSNFIQDMAQSYKEATIVSGLALGMDSVAHRAALENNLKTVAVLPCGLDKIYPSSNYSLARNILDSGGALVTEYSSFSSVFRHNFLARNRIVAALSVATVVVETPVIGGSMSTASLAVDYNKELFAFPGRVSDFNSKGCNKLIKSSKAQMIESFDDFEYEIGWQRPATLLDLFKPDLAGVEKQIYDYLSRNGEASSDQIIQALDITAAQFLKAVTILEFDGYIKSVRGNNFIITYGNF